MFFRLRCQFLGASIELIFPILMPPAVPWIEEISNQGFLPSQIRVGARNNEKGFAPGKDALETLAKSADGAFFSCFGSQVDLGNCVAVFLRKRSVVDNYQTRAA